MRVTQRIRHQYVLKLVVKSIRKAHEKVGNIEQAGVIRAWETKGRENDRRKC